MRIKVDGAYLVMLESDILPLTVTLIEHVSEFPASSSASYVIVCVPSVNDDPEVFDASVISRGVMTES